jgi:hypothetical protein
MLRNDEAAPKHVLSGLAWECGTRSQGHSSLSLSGSATGSEGTHISPTCTKRHPNKSMCQQEMAGRKIDTRTSL